MASLFGPFVSLVFIIFLVLLVLLYLASIAWTLRDAKDRGVSNKLYKWVSIIPFAGVLVYILLRPPLLLIDKKEQEIDIALKQRQLSFYGNCSNCGSPVTDEYVVCPNCEKKLKEVCDNCGSAIDFRWNICPFCGKANPRSQTFSNQNTGSQIAINKNGEENNNRNNNNNNNNNNNKYNNNNNNNNNNINNNNNNNHNNNKDKNFNFNFKKTSDK